MKVHGGGAMRQPQTPTMPTEKMSTPADTRVSASCPQKEQNERFLSNPADFCSVDVEPDVGCFAG